MTSLLSPNRDGPQPTDRERRNSYFEVLSSVSSDLNFVASDLRKAQVPFKASSPKSPLAVAASLPLLSPVDRYQHQIASRSTALGTNNNASTTPTHYTQLPTASALGDPSGISSPFFKSLNLPASPPGFVFSHQGAFQSSFEALGDLSGIHPGSHLSDDMEVSLLTRLVHTKPIWFLPNTQRSAAIHYLQGQPVRTFIVCQSRDKDNLVLTMKHPGKGTGLYIEKLPIFVTQHGVKLSSTAEEYSTIEDLILHHMYHEGALPCKLALPSEIMAARNIRALQSLALFEEEFWVRITQCRQGISKRQVEGHKDASAPTESSRGLSSFPVITPEKEYLKSKYPLQSSLSEGAKAPSLPTPKGYIIMNKQPTCVSVPQPTATEQLALASKIVSSRSDTTYMFMRNRNVSSIAIENRYLHKSWSCDEKNNPFQMSGVMATSQSQSRDSQTKSVDDTLLASFERQPMRCSTQSHQEYLMKNMGHYPPPLHSPPPPPTEPLSDIYSVASLKSSAAPPDVQRNSGEYYRPFEITKQGHRPPSVFGFDAVCQSPTPPLPLKRSMSSPQQGVHDENLGKVSTPPMNKLQYSSPYDHPKPQDYFALEAQLTSLDSSPAGETQEHVEPSQQLPPMFGSIENRRSLAPILQPALSEKHTSVSSELTTNPMFEFDPLFLSRELTQSSSSADPQSQDVFSAPPQFASPTQLAPEPQNSLLPSGQEVSLGVLLNLSLNSSEDEATEALGSADKCPQPLEGGTDDEFSDSSKDELEHTGDEEEDEEETARGDRSSLTGDTQSSHSSDAHGHAHNHPQDVRMTAIKDGDQTEQNINRLSRVTASQKKMIKKKKKKKKKKLSNFSRIQKYVMRGKTKKKQGDPTNEIQAAIHKLASNKSSYFSMMMSCFVKNIKEKEMSEKPNILIRNIRQFMSGMKNYLFNRREPEVDEAMDKYYSLTMAELDAIVEGAIHYYILMPLKSEIYKCFITEHKETGSLDELDHNIQLARAKTPAELGIKTNYIPPEGENLKKIRHYFRLLEEAYSPIKKLEHLLDIVRTIYDTVVDNNSSRGQSVQSMGADDFLPMFIYVLVQCEAVNIEIEADYMWGLLEPSMLSGEGGYYLTTLSSAICILKQFEQENQYTETKGFLSIMVASGKNSDHIVHKALPVLPGMNAGDVCRILAHKMKIDNAHQYQLYMLSGDQEIPIADNECPLQLKEEIEASHTRACFFGYKIEDQLIKWFS